MPAARKKPITADDLVVKGVRKEELDVSLITEALYRAAKANIRLRKGRPPLTEEEAKVEEALFQLTRAGLRSNGALQPTSGKQSSHEPSQQHRSASPSLGQLATSAEPKTAGQDWPISGLPVSPTPSELAPEPLQTSRTRPRRRLRDRLKSALSELRRS